jgi:tetratricopeptide (TPR) repeat protein
MKIQNCGVKSQLILIFFALFMIPSICGFGLEAPVKGVVKDKSGQALKDIKITFTDFQSGNKFSLKSNKEGKFTRYGIPPAEYKITVELEGYFTYVASLIVVYGQEQSLEIVLEKIPPKIDEDKDFQDGVSFFKQGQYKEAVALYEKVVARFPESAEAYYNLGVSSLRSGKIEEAIVSLEKAIQLKSDLAEAYFALGECYFNKGESAKAIQTFSRTVEMQANNPKAYYNLGVAYYKIDKTDEAIDAFGKAIELNPNFSSAYYQLGVAQVKKGDFKKAIELLEQFLRLEPKAPEAPQVKTMIDELKKQIGALLSFCSAP